VPLDALPVVVPVEALPPPPLPPLEAELETPVVVVTPCDALVDIVEPDEVACDEDSADATVPVGGSSVPAAQPGA